MKIENIFSYLVILALLFVSSLFTACNVNGPGIFYTIYNEKKISESLVSDKPVYKVVSAGSSLYVRAGAAVYKNDGTAWNKIDPPSAGMRAVSLGRIGSGAGIGVYAVYESESNGDITDKIYKLSGEEWSHAPGTESFSNISLVDVDDSTAEFMFISARTGISTFKNYAYNGTAIDPSDGFDSGKGLPLTGAAIHYDGTHNDYYLTASNSTTNSDSDSDSSAIYFYDVADGPDGTIYTLSDITTAISTFDFKQKTIGGISEDTNGNLYLSTGDGFLYTSNDGTTWSAVNSTALTDSYGTACLGDMAVVDYNGTDYLIIAADNGYFEMDLTGTSPELPTVTAENFETYELSQEAVFSLYTETDKIYIGSDNGLWLSEYSGGPALDKE